MLNRAIRLVQSVLALQLAFTLTASHDAVAAAIRLQHAPTLLDTISPYSQFREHADIGLTVVVALLLLAAMGVFPRVLVPIQFWLTAFFPVTCITVADGGDAIAGLLVFQVLPWFLDPGPQTMRLTRYAVRGQMALIYVCAGITKLEVPAWRQGVALRSYAGDPLDGIQNQTIMSVFDNSLVLHLLTWSTPLVEIALAAAVLAGPRYRRAALAAGLALHAAIAISFSLYTFQLIMIAGLVLLTEPWRGSDSAPDTAAAIPAGRQSKVRLLQVMGLYRRDVHG